MSRKTSKGGPLYIFCPGLDLVKGGKPDLMFEEKREGTFAKRVVSYTRGLRRVTSDELSDNPRENKAKLTELIEQANKTISLLDALIRR